MANATGTSDVHTMMLFEANKKSSGVAYLLWFFLGTAGAHRFYLGKSGSAIAMLALLIVGLLLFPVGGALLVLVDAIWALIDAFLIPDWIRAYNMDLVTKLTSVER